jgi:hypothetical protein
MADFNPAKIRFSKLPTLEKCGGHLAATKDLPKQPSGEAAQQGTDSHNATAMIVALGVGSPLDYAPNLPEGHVEAVEFASDAARALIVAAGADAAVAMEQQIDASPLFGFDPLTVAGTPDLTIVSGDTAHSIDYKYGLVPVPADTWQNRITLAYLANKYPSTDKFTSSIIQPRAADPILRVTSITFTRQDIEGWVVKQTPYFSSILNGTASRVAGDHCRYCQAKANCLEARDHVVGFLKQQGDAQKLTGEQIAASLRIRKMAEAWFEEVAAEGTKRVQADPDAVPGFTIGSRVTHRRWGSDTAVLNVISELNPELLDQLAPRKLVTPSNALKHAPAELAGELSAFVIKPAGSACLIPAEVAARRKKATQEDYLQALAQLQGEGAAFAEDL